MDNRDGFAGDETGEQRTPLCVLVFLVLSVLILLAEAWAFWVTGGWIINKLI